MASEPITGVGGKAYVDTVEVAHVRRWSMDRTADHQTYLTSSCTDGNKEVAPGGKHWTATIELLLEAGAALALDTDTKYLFKLDKDGTHYFEGYGYINRKGGPEVDIEGSGLVGVTVEVLGHGGPSNDT